MNKSPLLFVIVFISSLTVLAQNAVLAGEMKKFHKITLTWDGVGLVEEPETYKNFRLNVTFTSPSGKSFIVPGYYAADGNAAETSATSGNKWRCHFNPLEKGMWSYTASFRTAENIAISFDPQEGDPISGIDGDSGAFEIMETDKSGKDFRGKGKLEYVGEHFLQWTNGEFFLKLGTNTPEVFLEYVDFDNSPQNPRPGYFDRDYAAHIPDWEVGDPLWQASKGKGIIGAVNYLSSQGVNAHYFLTDSSYGDTDTIFPWVDIDAHYVYDTSKLDQWQIVFDHMMQKGVKVHFVLSEAEQQSLYELFDDFEGDDQFANARKIYYREMVARFGYLNAITWNLGEENGWDRPDHIYGRGLTSDQQIAFAGYIDSLAYYNDHITLQNGHASDDSVYANLIGDNSFTGASLQGVAWDTRRSRTSVFNWKEKSDLANKKWVVSYDEAFHSNFTGYDVFRQKALWASLTAGAAGFEYYVPQNTFDWRVQDYSAYHEIWTYMRYAKEFFTDNNIPFYEMKDKSQMVSNGWVLGKDYEVYVIYLPSQGTTTAEITGEYSVKWFDPRNGGSLLDGSVATVSDGSNVSIGTPPNNPDLDWVVLLRTIQTGPVNVEGISVSPPADKIGEGWSIRLTANVIPLNADNTQYNWSSDNPSIASVDENGVVTAHLIGETLITVTSDEGNFTDSSIITVLDSSDFCGFNGTILMERYDEILGEDLNSLLTSTSYPNSPTSTFELDKFQIPTDVADHYGTRVSGYLCPPESGTYYFWISGDDNTQLKISTDTNPLKSTIIAYHNAWTTSEEWDKFPTQKSSGIHLEVDETYYIEAILKEGGGGDNLAVAWRKPSNGDGNVPHEIIPGSVLSPRFSASVPTTGVTVTPSQISLDSASSTQLTAIVSPIRADNYSVSWSSDNTNVVTVDSNGLVTAVSPGVTSIIVTTSDGNFTAMAIIEVSAIPVQVTGVTLDPLELTLQNGNSTQLTATVLPVNADNKGVSWSSSDSGVATVDVNGLVTAVSQGTADISVTSLDGNFTAVVSVTVTPMPLSVTGVTVYPSSISIERGSVSQLTAAIVPVDAANTTVTWSSNNTDVATVDLNGLVTAISPGTATITVSTDDGNYTSGAIIQVEDLNVVYEEDAIVYPNPSENLVHIVFPEPNSVVQIQVYDAIGRLIQEVKETEFEIQNDIIQFSTLFLKDATYFVHVQTNSSERFEFRLIVKK